MVDGSVCEWMLTDEPILQAGEGATPPQPASPPPSTPSRHCANGHSIPEGDEICLICGGDPVQEPQEPARPLLPEPPTEKVIDGWRVLGRTGRTNPTEPWDRFIVQRDPDTAEALLTLYQVGSEPDPAVHDALRRMPLDHIPELLATGTFEGRTYEVVEFVRGGCLADLDAIGQNDHAQLSRIVDELGRALASFAEIGLRHRDLRPETILLRTRDPLDLVITSFGSARLSDFDLEAVAPLEITRYSAPEVIVGAVSAASDWWSLGMILLERATQGACFEGVNDQAFRIHVVTRGVSVPKGLDPRIHLLLRGLLARDPLKRWAGSDVAAWLSGATIEAPEEQSPETSEATGPTITLAGRTYSRPPEFALAGAEAVNWAEARDLTLRGAVATWLDARAADPQMVAEVRRLTSAESLSDDFRHSLALMAMNPTMPLVVAGIIVTPAWLLGHPAEGYGLISGEVVRHLESMRRELWLVRLGARAESVRERATILEIELDEERARIAMLASSRANLEAERVLQRRLYPDTDHVGLSSIVERPRLTDEDLIILVSASTHQFVPMASLIDATIELAQRTGVTIDRAELNRLLACPRRELFTTVDERIANFARCGITRIDEWADSFRIERRLPLARAALLLAVPPAAWTEPPKQQYIANLLEHFEKRVAGAVGRGPLVRFIIGKTTPRVDLFDLGTSLRTAEALLNHVLSRVEIATPLDPHAYVSDEALAGRLRRMVNHALTFRRDTGIDGRYLAFPFLLLKDARLVSSTSAPRVAPVLLWPVAVDLLSGAQRAASIMFDREREEIRLNPALEGLLGAETFARWKVAREELLQRPVIRLGDAIDVFGTLARPRGRSLTKLPGKDTKISPGVIELAPAAALFNAEFTGQAVASDLRQMRGMPPRGTGLEATMRVVSSPPVSPILGQIPEKDRYLTVESDPSQDDAVLSARFAPGLVVEGPPGTGKSQTIVNIVAEAIGRGESVLVVCQKQAALKVVQKRLDAEGLGERLCLVSDIASDRQTVIRAVREQLAAVQGASKDQDAWLRRTREEKAARIETLEKQIDGNHEALYAIDDRTGFTYRGLIGDLLGVEAEGPTLDVPSLRPLFVDADRATVSAIEETCGTYARLWLESEYEGSPLFALRIFPIDEAVRQDIETEFAAFAAADAARIDTLNSTAAAFDIVDPAPFQGWLNAHRARFSEMPSESRQRLASWFNLFQSPGDGECRASDLMCGVEEAVSGLIALEAEGHDKELFRQIASQTPIELGVEIEKKYGHSARLWFESGFQGTPHPTLRSSALDTASRDIDTALSHFVRTEAARTATLQSASTAFAIEDPRPYRTWLDANSALFMQMVDDDRERLAAWFDLFWPEHSTGSRAAKLMHGLEATKMRLDRLDANAHDNDLSAPISVLAENELWALHTAARKATAAVSFFSRLNPFRSKHKRRSAAFLAEHGRGTSEAQLISLRDALALEAELRKLRPKIDDALRELYGVEHQDPTSLETLRFQCTAILSALCATEAIAMAISGCPNVQDAAIAARTGTRKAFESLILAFEDSLRRHAAIENSLKALAPLGEWFQEGWLTDCHAHITHDAATDDLVQQIIDALTTLRRMQELRNALSFESKVANLRSVIEATQMELFPNVPERPVTLTGLRVQGESILRALHSIEPAARAALNCPRPAEAKTAILAASEQAMRALFGRFEESLRRHAAIAGSRDRLEQLKSWFQDVWIESCATRIASHAGTSDLREDVCTALPRLVAFQRFRMLAPSFPPEAIRTFAAIRRRQDELKSIAPGELDGMVRRTLKRETLLAWKGRMETLRPELLADQAQIQHKVDTLAILDREMRGHNKFLLSQIFDRSRLATQAAWGQITLLSGPRARRLREFFDEGRELGLMHLRPIWLMNPDVASRMLPLQAGVFDLVVYDEASQMLVEHAAPTLFRAKRVVISGDEKQMPPTSFFSSRIDSDEDEDFDGEGLDNAATEAERIAYEETWNRREVKDCPDLLQLGRGVLPSTTLKIHYRSKYRELISYSNAAFYRNALSVPARHPNAEIRRAKPIEVIRVDGVYENQTNCIEAEKVAELLKEIWSEPVENRPSLGVVTFNRKQADLVEDEIERRAVSDPVFLRALQQERDRKQGGEEMGFFVKNVENVQGDERDIIIFSTTFGRDKQGGFRRNFGVLGQTGGERRLNVAVTRARSKVVLITSIPIGDVSDWLSAGRLPSKPRDYLQAYLDYSAKISMGELESGRVVTARLAGSVQNTRRAAVVNHDGFATSVKTFIRALGYEPVATTDTDDVFALDFAIEDARTGLFGIGIECDAPRHSLLGRARAREIWRPSVLSNTVPKVHRVASGAWYHNTDEEKQRLHSAIRAALS
ncbi:MAG: AAA domain-containing protein [Methylocella sp.]